MNRGITLAVVSLLAAACGRTVDVAGEEQALLRVDRAWAAASLSGNVDSIVSYWTDDAHVLQPGLPVLQGKAAIRSMVASSLAVPGFRITWTPGTAVVAASGDLGYTSGVNEVTVPDKAGHLTTTAGRYITLWRKGSDGRWRCVEDMSNSGPDARPAS